MEIETPADRTSRYIIPAIVGLVTFLAFLPALRADFVTWDDDTNFLRNPMYRGLAWTNIKWMWSTFLLGHYVPLSWMTLGLDYQLWGMDARGYHLTNLLIHAANAVLLYYVARSLVGQALGERSRHVELASALGVLLYSVHPLRVESAAWITERRDVLSTFFVLAAMLAYLRSVIEPEFNRWYWIAVALFIAALLSKATAVTLPAVLLVVNVLPLRRLRLDEWRGPAARRVYRELAPMLLLSAGAGVLSLIALHAGKQLTIAQKAAVSLFSLRFYLQKTLWPAGLSPLYEMPKQVDPGALPYVISYAVCLLFVVLLVVALKRWPLVAAGLVAFLAMILPLLGPVQNGQQIAADRYTYQGMQAIAVLIAGLLASWWRRGVGLAATALVVILAALTWRQTGYWRDSTTLWQRVLRVDDSSSVAHTALANVFSSAGQLDSAIEHYQRSLAINPVSLEVDNNLGIALMKNGRPLDAVAHFRRAIEINPDHYEANNNLGSIFSAAGESDSAIAHFRRALEIHPDFPDAEVNWGNALLRKGRPADAVEHYQRALAMKPANADAEYNWGVAMAQQGKLTDAIEHFQRTLSLNPSHAEARNALALAERLARQKGR
jgi:Tfp pilus assembly protein PilF